MTANLDHRAEDGRTAPDLIPGPKYCGRFTNVRPLLADFLVADPAVVEARRRAIGAAEYRRCEDFAYDAMRASQGVRDGRPLVAGVPARRRNS